MGKNNNSIATKTSNSSLNGFCTERVITYGNVGYNRYFRVEIMGVRSITLSLRYISHTVCKPLD